MNEHDDIEILLPEFIRGDLPSTDRERVAAHLAACPDCRAREAEYRQLLGDLHGIAISERNAHLPELDIARYVSAPQELVATERERIELHLDVCERCAADAGAAAELIRAVPLTAKAGLSEPPDKPTDRRWTSILVHPAFAYSIAAVALFALLLSDSGRQPEHPGYIAPEQIQALVTLPEQIRNAGTRPEVKFAPGQNDVLLEMGFASHAGRAIATSIQDESGREIVRDTAPAVSFQRGFAIVRLERSDVNQGNYTAIIEAVSATGDTSRVFYPFKVKK